MRSTWNFRLQSRPAQSSRQGKIGSFVYFILPPEPFRQFHWTRFHAGQRTDWMVLNQEGEIESFAELPTSPCLRRPRGGPMWVCVPALVPHLALNLSRPGRD